MATFVEERDFRGVKVNRFIAGFGDMSTDPKLKCYCPKPDFCLKKGVHDLTNCVGAPIVTSLPHFWDGDESYQKGVRGLHPNEHEHGIELIFESVIILDVLQKFTIKIGTFGISSYLESRLVCDVTFDFKMTSGFAASQRYRHISPGKTPRCLLP